MGVETDTIDGARESVGPSQTSDASTIVSSVRMLVDVMRTGNVTELDLSFGDVSIRLRTGSTGAGQVAGAAPLPSSSGAPTPIPQVPNHEQHITSPMVGTFYASPTPGSPAYVKVGDYVEVGQTVGIVEAMKIMNEIAADRAGLVTEVLVDNGEAVEYGSKILSIDPTRGGMVSVVGSGS